MHLFIDASRANAEEPTGVEEYAWHTIEELKKIVPPDWRVTLFSRGFETPPASPPLSKGGKFDAAPLPPNWQSRVLRWPPKRLWTQVRLSAAMARLSFRPSPQPSPSREREVLFVPAHVMPMVHLPKTVVTIHDVGVLRFPHIYSPFERWYIKWSTAFALRRGAHILVPSEFTKKEIVRLFLSPSPPPFPSGGEGAKRFPLPLVGEGKGEGEFDRIHVVPLAYDTTRYHAHLDPAETEQVIAKYGITKPYFYFQGRIEEKKNVARLVEAFSQFSYNLKPITYNLVLAGKPGYGFEKVKGAIEVISSATPPVAPPLVRGGKLGGSFPHLDKRGEVAKDHIRFLGYVPPEDAPYLMAGASVFVFPSLYEGFGIPMLEAMAVGTPVVAARAGSLPEVGSDAALYFDPQNVEDITSTLTRIMEDQPLREALRARGFERVKNFLWKKTAEDTCRVLTAVAN